MTILVPLGSGVWVAPIPHGRAFPADLRTGAGHAYVLLGSGAQEARSENTRTTAGDSNS